MPVMRLTSAVLFLLLVTFPLVADDLKTLSGKAVSGTLVSIADGEIVVDTKDGAVTTPLAQALLLDLASTSKASATKYSALRLIDDAVIHCTDVAFVGP